METEILLKVQQNYRRWQVTKDSQSGHWQDTGGEYMYYTQTNCLPNPHYAIFLYLHSYFKIPTNSL